MIEHHYPDKRGPWQRARHTLMGLVDLADGAVAVVSLGGWYLDLSYKVLFDQGPLGDALERMENNQPPWPTRTTT